MEHMLFMKTEIARNAFQTEILYGLHKGTLFDKELSGCIDWWWLSNMWNHLLEKNIANFEFEIEQTPNYSNYSHNYNIIQY